MKIPVLFCEENSIYKTLTGRNRVLLCEVYDKKRNALNYTGTLAAVYHPPCQLWCRLRTFSTADDYEKFFGVWAVRQVQTHGGIIEHPMGSSLFNAMKLPYPGKSDQYGFTIEIDQYHFGHVFRKRTWLYIVGLTQGDRSLDYKKIPGSARYKIGGTGAPSKRYNVATPKKFAKYLVKICAQINKLKGLT